MHPGKNPANGQAAPDANLNRAVDILRGGGVIAYPNETVYGLGCLPDQEAAVERVLQLKGRDRSLGLILIAAEWEQFEGWAADLDALRNSREAREGRGITWVVVAAPRAPGWITGGRDTIAIRRSLHPLASALSRAVDSPLVSTSCNPHSRPPAHTTAAAAEYFAEQVDWVMPGECGPLKGPSEIRDAATGRVLRPKQSTSNGEPVEIKRR